jgi:hypothetical protein
MARRSCRASRSPRPVWMRAVVRPRPRGWMPVAPVGRGQVPVRHGTVLSSLLSSPHRTGEITQQGGGGDASPTSVSNEDGLPVARIMVMDAHRSGGRQLTLASPSTRVSSPLVEITSLTNWCLDRRLIEGTGSALQHRGYRPPSPRLERPRRLDMRVSDFSPGHHGVDERLDWQVRPYRWADAWG